MALGSWSVRGPRSQVRTFYTPFRLRLWGATIFALSWFVHVHTMATPGLVDRAGRFKGSDYTQFYVMGSLAREGRLDALYDSSAHLAEGRARIDPALGLYASHPNYGPQVALAFSPLARLPYAWSLAVFLTASALCYGLAVWLVWRECDALRSHGGVVALLAAGSPLFLTVVRYGQASAFGLLALAVAFVALRRRALFAAGLAIGCLVYKPQLGIVIGVVMLVSRQWRVVAGATLSAAGQLAIGWLAAGSAVFAQYIAELRLLILDPSVVELYPSEVHSIRGFVQLLIPSAPVVITLAACVALLVALVAGARTWMTTAPVGIRWSALIVLTVLASPHLITYDLLLLTVPLLLMADWAARHRDHALGPWVRALLVLVYLAPFSAMIVARLTGVQVSVVVMAVLAWLMHQIARESLAIVAPRWESVSSQNSATRGWRSSAA